MYYKSTRDSSVRVESAVAISQGISADGGLFVPEQIPSITKEELAALADKTYAQRAAFVFSRYLTDFTEAELVYCTESAYNTKRFETENIAEIAHLFEGTYMLELWHGPTCAFKDMALQILPYFLTTAMKKLQLKEKIVILVATSGDTGKAALEGFKDVEGTEIMVFYPEEGVSDMQKRQMVTQEGSNVNVCAVKGNFDDCQSGVKKIFTDKTVKEELAAGNMRFSSANSINWGRLVPQIVYYVSSYVTLVQQGELKMGETLNVVVPTGNFGNILAAYYAKQMGVPLGKLICASNINKVLTDFINTGIYNRNREFYATCSPSMDILISSNLERLLYFVAGEKRTAEYMRALRETGKYTVEPDILATIRQDFAGYFTDEAETSQTIRAFFESGYLADTHTAVALHAATEYRTQTDDRTPIVIASTASPFKFATDVYRSVTGNTPAEPLTAPERLSELSGWDIPYPLKGLRERKIRFTKTVEKNEMRDAIRLFLSGTEQ